LIASKLQQSFADFVDWYGKGQILAGGVPAQVRQPLLQLNAAQTEVSGRSGG
jgi:hypothetical protein